MAERYAETGKSDRIALTVRQGGSIRGFMNDGSIDMKGHHSLDSLAFGHCDYSFRNLGRPSKLQIRQQHENFEVIVDEKLCFASNKVNVQLRTLAHRLTALPDSYADRLHVWRHSSLC